MDVLSNSITVIIYIDFLLYYQTGSLLSKAWSSTSVASNADVNDDNLPFNEMVLKFAEKVSF